MVLHLSTQVIMAKLILTAKLVYSNRTVIIDEYTLIFKKPWASQSDIPSHGYTVVHM